ncbi:MAG TPA: PHP-associated domain-containing protein [Candidatus Binatia bacterium]|nr:PHP-associated domain-containing protein [Candidatus Binatia bacterium]
MTTGPGEEAARPRAFLDLHCHTAASFDSRSRPRDVVRAAFERGLTHLAITDHDRIEGALEAQALAPPGLVVLVGEEIRTREGDLIGLFLRAAVPPGLSAREAIAAVREQGGLVGIPHPFDRWRGSLGRRAWLRDLAPLVDWVEVHNARTLFRANARAAAFAAEHGLPGVAVSDAHTLLEVGVASTVVDGDPSTPDDLRAALRTASLVTGRGSLVARLATPIAKGLNWWQGNRRRRPGRGGPEPTDDG